MNKKHFLLFLFITAVTTNILSQGATDTKNGSLMLHKVNGFLSDNVKLTGYGQVGYRYTDRENATVNNEFYGNLVMLILSGKVNEDLSWMIQYECFSSKLLELYGDYHPYPFLRVKFGQMKTCFTLENQISPSLYETVKWDRAIGRFAALTSEDICKGQGGRDIGIQVGGNIIKMPFNDFLVEYNVGVYNGSGMSIKDHNSAKDVAASLMFQPIKNFHIGGSGYLGRLYYEEYNENTNLSRNIDRNRAALSSIYKNDRLTLRGEYIWGKDENIHKNGFYAMGHYYIKPSRIALVGKIEGFDTNTRIGENYETVYTAGVNYFFNLTTRIMLNYVHYEEAQSTNEIWAQLQIGL